MLKIGTKLIFKGQALLTLLIFTIIGITVTSGAVVMIMVNSLSGTKQQQSEITYEIAQSGADNGLIRVLRTPTTYTGETLAVGSGSATITVTGNGGSTTPFIIISKGTNGNFVRTIQVTATYQNNVLTVTSRKEIYQ